MILPAFAKCPVEKLADEWELDTPECERVQAVIPGYDGKAKTFSTWKYNFLWYDRVYKQTFSCGIYYDETKTELLGIDFDALNIDNGWKYPIIETPFYSIFRWLERNF
jgi:hypothetical protein